MLDIVEGATDSIVFNEGGADVDFRVESDGQPNMFVVDAGNNQVVMENVTNWDAGCLFIRNANDADRE